MKLGKSTFDILALRLVAKNRVAYYFIRSQTHNHPSGNLTPSKADGTNNKINISYKNLSLDLDIDDIILLDEGNIELSVTGIKNTDITCKVIRGGILKNNKSLNVPGVGLSIDFLSNTDKNDILFASKLDVDFISLSFVRTANDILDVNDLLISERNEHLQIITKIENKSAIEERRWN